MNEQLYQKWIDALESGEYKDGRQFLRYDHNNDTMYCCLGVLCEVSKLGTWVSYPNENFQAYSIDDDIIDNFALPEKLAEEMSFKTPNGDFNLSDLSNDLLPEILYHVELAGGLDIKLVEDISLVEINDRFVPRDDSDITSPFTLIAKVLREAPESLFNE